MNPSPEEIKAVLQSPEARQLLRQLQKDGGGTFSQAAAAFRSGDAAKAVSLLQPMIQNRQSEKLLQEIQQQIG